MKRPAGISASTLQALDVRGAVPKREHIPRRLVKCPTCGAEIGKPCVTEKGNDLPNSHRTRKRMSFRKYFEQEM